MQDLNKLIALTDEQIEQLGLSVSDLWMLQSDNQDISGPFSTKYLIKKSKENNDYFENLQVYNLVVEQWKDFFNTTEFQRRRPKLVPAQNLVKNEDFYILVKGQKHGPIKLDDLKEMLSNRLIQLNNEISVDEGKTWIKLFEHHQFDRRLEKQRDDLPFQPQNNTFVEDEKVTLVHFNKLQKKKEDETALSGLAFIGRGNDKGQVIKLEEKSDLEKSSKKQAKVIELDIPRSKLSQKLESINWKYVASFVAIAFTSFGLMNSFNNSTSFSNIEITHQSKKVTPTKTESINNSQRVNEYEQVQRKPASTAPKRVAPTKPIKANYHPKRAITNKRVQEEPKVYQVRHRVEHDAEDFDHLDVEDSRVREALSRELASDYDDFTEDDLDYQPNHQPRTQVPQRDNDIDHYDQYDDEPQIRNNRHQYPNDYDQGQDVDDYSDYD